MTLCYYSAEKFDFKSTIKIVINNIKNSLNSCFFTEKYYFFNEDVLPMIFLCYQAENFYSKLTVSSVINK